MLEDQYHQANIYTGHSKSTTKESTKTNLMHCREKRGRHAIWKMQIPRKLYIMVMKLFPLYSIAFEMYDKNA